MRACESIPLEETMKIPFVIALVGLVISFSLSALAQQKSAADPQIRQQLDALGQKGDEAFNDGDAVALAASFAEDAVLINDTGPVYGREAIEKYYAELFQKVHFSDWITTVDQNSPHIIETARDVAWETGRWSGTIKGQNFGPVRSKGYWSSIAVLDGDVWKKRMQMSNVDRNYQAGAAISFAAPAFAQKKDTVDPQIIERLEAVRKKVDEAWNNNDAATLAATYTEDAVLVTDTGSVYGREAIEEHYADLFKQVHISNHTSKTDQYSPHMIGTAGSGVWSNGEWSLTYQVNGGAPVQLRGYSSTIYVRQGDAWKRQMGISNVTP
jgi:ketosteroid isomerase-like protein